MSFISKVVTGAFIGLAVYAVAERVKKNRQFRQDLDALSNFDAKGCVDRALAGVQDSLAKQNLATAESFKKRAIELREEAGKALKEGNLDLAAFLSARATRNDELADAYHSAWFNKKGVNQEPVWTPSAN